jgi:monofunctional glycosyltransferase
MLNRVAKLTFRLFAAFILLSVALVLVYKWLPIPVTPLMTWRVVENLVEGKPIRLDKRWVPMSQISSRLENAVVAAEDFRFYEHGGFDWVAIEKALKSNERGRRMRGGSTISQQTAKNVFLWPSRSWVRKGFEAYFTVLIEWIWGKERIMEAYLNVVELGDGIYGVEAASQAFFKKPAAKLNSSEAALIAAVLPNPRRFLVSKPTPYTRFRQTMIQRRMPTAARLVPRE